MKLYYITDRHSARGDLLPVIERVLQAGVDLIQIREKDMSARELLDLTRQVVALGRSAKVLVNARVDIAMAAAADGVHLPAGSPSPREIRSIAPRGFVIGVSCHHIGEVRRAADEGADFVAFGPVFATSSKLVYGDPQGLDRLAEACRSSSIPVLALGGVGLDNAAQCIAAGAAGIAGISLFQQADDPVNLVASLRTGESGPALRRSHR